MPKTREDAEHIIIEMGFDVCKNTKSVLTFLYDGREITYFHKSEWFSGKGVTDGRGWDNLISQIKPQDFKLCCPNCGYKIY